LCSVTVHGKGTFVADPLPDSGVGDGEQKQVTPLRDDAVTAEHASCWRIPSDAW
jgi:hypothetical protein